MIILVNYKYLTTKEIFSFHDYFRMRGGRSVMVDLLTPERTPSAKSADDADFRKLFFSNLSVDFLFFPFNPARGVKCITVGESQRNLRIGSIPAFLAPHGAGLSIASIIISPLPGLM
jgi:hypothetical protein